MVDPRQPFGEAGIGRKVLLARRLEKAGPEFRRTGHVDGDPFLVGAFEGVGLADNRAGKWSHNLVQAVVMGKAVEVEVAHGLEHRDIQTPPLSRQSPFYQRGQDASGSVVARHRIRDGRADHAGIGGRGHEAQEAGCRLCHRVIGRPIAGGTGGSEAGDGAVDDLRVDLAQVILARAKLFSDARTEVLDEDIGAFDERVEDGQIFGCLRIQRDGALVAIVGLKMGAVETALERAERVALAGTLDLDHIGTEIGQLHRSGGTSDVGPHFHHKDVLQRFHSALSPS